MDFKTAVANEILNAMKASFGDVDIAPADIAGALWLDFTLANKGSGIRRLARMLGVSLRDTAAFGDQYNDLSMLEIVGHPYLMEHAPEDLRTRGFAPCRNVSDALDELMNF